MTTAVDYDLQAEITLLRAENTKLKHEVGRLKIYAPAQPPIASPARAKALQETDLHFWGLTAD